MPEREGTVGREHVEFLVRSLPDDSEHPHCEEMLAVDAALRAEVKRLTGLLEECNAVCLCGCPAGEHESYGEDGESCGRDDHECIRVAPAALAYVNRLRAAAASSEAVSPAFRGGKTLAMLDRIGECIRTGKTVHYLGPLGECWIVAERPAPAALPERKEKDYEAARIEAAALLRSVAPGLEAHRSLAVQITQVSNAVAGMRRPAPAPAALPECVAEAAERLWYRLTPPANTTENGCLFVPAEDLETVLRALAALPVGVAEAANRLITRAMHTPFCRMNYPADRFCDCGLDGAKAALLAALAAKGGR